MPSGRSNLENLARAKQLNAEAPDEQEIANLLSAARRLLRDGRHAGLSADSRFALAYNAAHSLALAALRGAGYRPSSAGHRRVVFQTLEATAGASRELWVALDRYHDRRNRIEYEGVPVSTIEATDLLKLAAELQSAVLKRFYPLKKGS
jgi:hypothetical protein